MNTQIETELKQKAILLPDGSINKEKLNHISGAYTLVLVEEIWQMGEENIDTLNYISDIFTRLFSDGKDAELMDFINILYKIMDIELPIEIELLSHHQEARQYYLFEFLLDFEDILENLINEYPTE